mgnify:CR=1 FL=1
MANGFDEEAVAGCGCILAVPVMLVALLIAYGVLVIVIRNAFGVELPNPVDLLPTDWADDVRGWGSR